MEILQLKYFCDAAESQNFSKTAKKFDVPPSNISQCIKRLENELSVSLFNRKSNSITLNEVGKAFYDKIRPALKLIEEAKEETEGKNQQKKIKICIVASRRIIMNAIEKFSIKFPEIGFIISHKLDEEEEYDLIINDDMFTGKNLGCTAIISEKISLAVKKDHPLAQKNEINISDIKNENFISLGRESGLYAVTHRFCSDNNFEPNVVIQSEDPFYMRKCIELGLGVAFIPELSWREMFSDEVAIKHIAGFSRKICAFWNKNDVMSKWTKAFLKLLVVECEKEMTKQENEKLA